MERTTCLWESDKKATQAQINDHYSPTWQVPTLHMIFIESMTRKDPDLVRFATLYRDERPLEGGVQSLWLSFSKNAQNMTREDADLLNGLANLSH